jgi:hypothetical protein
MKRLTNEEIRTFITPKANEEAVWNFLGTAHYCGGYLNALSNLIMDADLYKWNAATTKAILEGLKYANES